MQVKKDQTTPTTTTLTISADQALLDSVKMATLKRLSKNLKLAGFRAGKAPLGLIEKNVDSSALQSEFLEIAINELYVQAIDEAKLRPVAQPKVTVSKFVPFTTLEFVAEVEAIGDVKLADYKKIKLAKKPVKITAKDIDEVIATLKVRAADKKEVKRAAKDGDQLTIDFKGVDAKTDEPINGADGKGYPLVLGSNTFIPGFEPNLIGLKAGEDKTFTITFPKDYGVKTLQNREVRFTVTAHKVEEVVEPKLDDAFAAKVGPFKTTAELRADIEKQLLSEKQSQADRDYENELLEKITDKSDVAIPAVLVEEEIDRSEQQERQNLAYRGQTWQEHLKEEGVTEAEHRERQRDVAEKRVKAGVVLSEIAQAEQISVSPEDVDLRIQLLKGQYTDPAMQAELDKPENRRDIMSRMISEQTIARLTTYAA